MTYPVQIDTTPNFKFQIIPNQALNPKVNFAYVIGTAQSDNSVVVGSTNDNIYSFWFFIPKTSFPGTFYIFRQDSEFNFNPSTNQITNGNHLYYESGATTKFSLKNLQDYAAYEWTILNTINDDPDNFGALIGNDATVCIAIDKKRGESRSTYHVYKQSQCHRSVRHPFRRSPAIFKYRHSMVSEATPSLIEKQYKK